MPRQLPGAVRHFTGRAPELKALTDLLNQADESPGAVVISAIDGTAGVGKTALALFWAHQVAEHFPDGQLYVNLRGFDPAAPPVATADALHGFFDAFEVPAARIPESLEAQVSLYRSLMAGRRALVVLDNARDAEQVSHLLPGASGCLAVVTSRCQLTGLTVAHGAQPTTLGMFSSFEARAFLSRRLGAEQIAAETGAVDELIELCAGLPLALSIVAAQALTRPTLSLAVLASQLRDMTRRLDVLDSGDRATGIRPVISWSYRNLSAEAARMFRLMAMHPGPDISVPAAASLVGIPCPDARGVLAELARAHMMTEHASGRFAFHDLLRAYAGEQTRASDSAAARRAAVNRILDYYLHAGHTATLLLNPARDSVVLAAPASGVVSDQIVSHADASAWFTAEYQVLLAVISQAFGESFHVHAWKIAWTLDTFLEASGRWHVMAKVHRIALAAAQRQGDDVGQGSAHCDLGATHIRLGLHDEATAHLRQAIRLAQRCGDQAGLARCHYTLGWAFAEQGKHSEALDHARQALTLFTATGHSQGQAGALSCLALCLAHMGDIQSAVAYGERALRLQRELRNGIGEADTWDILGQAYYRDGQFDQAVAHYQRAIDLCCQLGDRYTEAQVRQHIGEA
ncbi:MAG: tetratricopeptide repeat protein, partial [Solirubrobacteraceae bacterium]